MFIFFFPLPHIFQEWSISPFCEFLKKFRQNIWKNRLEKPAQVQFGCTFKCLNELSIEFQQKKKKKKTIHWQLRSYRRTRDIFEGLSLSIDYSFQDHPLQLKVSLQSVKKQQTFSTEIISS